MKQMKQTINLSKRDVAFTLKRSERARLLRLEISGWTGLVVTAPSRLPMARIENFIRERAGWVLEKMAIFDAARPVNRIGGGRRDYLKNKEAARALVLDRLEFFNRDRRFNYGQVKIKNQKSRWGSCSRKGNLNFNYKIIRLPSRLADYIIAHELCHLCEFNHGLSFWRKLSGILPDCRALRQELSRYRSWH